MMRSHSAIRLKFLTVLSTIIFSATALSISNRTTTRTEDFSESCKLLVIAHRGASGYVPEHTLGAYALAITMGADYVEPDLVMTKDGHLVARHENEIALSTDVADHTEFADRRRTQTIDGDQISGWFTEDFTLDELKTLRAEERIPDIRPGNTRMDKSFEIPTMEEVINLVKSMQISHRRVIGIYPEIKHSTHFHSIGLPMEQSLVEMLHRHGYLLHDSPVFIQSFEVNNLKDLRNMTNLRLLQLYNSNQARQPFDQVGSTNLTYSAMATLEGLREVATYADAVGPDKSYIIPRDSDGRLLTATGFVEDAHAAGLLVHPYTFRSENEFLPLQFRNEDPSPSAIGNFAGELQAFIDAGIDGLFADQPDVPAALRGSCMPSSATTQRSFGMFIISIISTIVLIKYLLL